MPMSVRYTHFGGRVVKENRGAAGAWRYVSEGSVSTVLTLR